MTDDRFATEDFAGGGLDGFTGTIRTFFFQEGEYGLSACVISAFDDPVSFPQYEDGTFTRWFPLGKKGPKGAQTAWTTPDMGKTATHAEGGKVRTDTAFGQLIRALGNIPGIGDTLPADWTGYRDSDWVGLHLEWGRIPVPVRKQIDGEWKNTTENQLMPVALAGDTQLALSSNGAGSVDVSSLGLTSDQETKLSEAAKTSGDAAKFIAAVVGIDAGLMAGTPFAAAVAKDAEAVRQALADVII